MSTAFVVEVRRQINASGLTEQKKQVLIGLLTGVEGGEIEGVPWYHYSCPFPFYHKESRQGWADTLCQALIDKAGQLDLQPPTTLEEKKALFERVFLSDACLPIVALYPGYASGDMYGFGAAMTITPSMQLIILKDEPKSKRIDRSASVDGFMKDIGVSARTRVAQVVRAESKNINPEDVKKPNGSTGKYVKALDEILWKLFGETGKIHCVMDLFFATKYVALKFAQNPDECRNSLRRNWLELGTLRGPDGAVLKPRMKNFIAEQIGGHQVMPKGANIVVLWSRFTGKTGGAHIEYDSSVQGMRQLIACAFASGAEYVFITGDAPKASANASFEKKQKREQMYATLRDEVMQSPTGTYTKQRRGGGLELRLKQVVILTEFWTRPNWHDGCATQKENVKRTDQFKLWEVLHQANKVKHFGARSGNLESLALLGYEVCYFEDHPAPEYAHEQEDVPLGDALYLLTHPQRRSSPTVFPQKDEPGALDKARMQPWHATVKYQRLQLSQVPTRSGKYLIHKNSAGKAVPWSYKTRVTPEQVESAYLSHCMTSLDALPPNALSLVEKAQVLGLKQDAMKPEEIQPFQKGFPTKDLIAIADYFMFK